ncbi:MAG: HAD family hydrolase [Candidatus Bathyarchaeota archaeon]|nr:HAD family hydrolase [Candidatus Bathyarchaeota archaeon]
MKWEVVSFDFDETLARMVPPIHETIGTILSRYGFPGKSEVIAELLKDKVALYARLMKKNRNWRALPRKARIDALNLFILEELGIESGLNRLLNALDSEWFATKELHSDVPYGFERLKKMGVDIAILAGPSSKVIKKVLGKHGLLDYVVCYATGDIVCPELGKLCKEDGTAYTYLLRKTGSKPDEVIHVGDDIQVDYEVARKIGITPVLINRSGREDLKRAAQKGCFVVQNMKEFLHWIEEQKD